MSNIFSFLLKNLEGDAVLFKFNFTIMLDTIGATLGKIFGIAFYMISYILFMIIDFFSIVFRSLLGLGNPGTINLKSLGEAGTQTFNNDFVLMILNSRTIQNVFFSLSIIALFLLVIAVIVAIIRSEYNWDKAGNSKGPIFSKAFKAIALYFTVPVACLFGVYAASLLLKAVDQATRNGENSYVSSLVFSASAFQGNRIRNDTTWAALGYEYKYYKNQSGYTEIGNMPFVSKYMLEGFVKMNDGKSSDDYWTISVGFASNLENVWESNKSEDSQEEFAANIDTLFESGATINALGNTATYPHGLEFDSAVILDTKPYDNVAKDNPELKIIRDGLKAVRQTSTNLFRTAQRCSPYNIELVWFYYNLLPNGYSHVLSLLVGFLLIKTLFDMACGVVKRAYELVVLFTISPPIVALMPLDDGQAYRTWVKTFIGKVLMGFGGVVAINFFFMLVPAFKTIKIFNIDTFDIGFFGGKWIAAFFNCLTQLLFVLAGGMSLSSLSKMISNIIGAEDAAESGSKVSGAVAGMGAKLGGMALGGAKKALGGVVKLGDKLLGKPPTPPKTPEQEAKEKAIKEGLESGDVEKMAAAEFLRSGGPGGGSGGGGKGGKDKPATPILGEGKLSNFIRNAGDTIGNIPVLGAVGRAAGGAIAAAGRFYGSAISQIDGEGGKKFSKNFEAGQQIGYQTAGVVVDPAVDIATIVGKEAINIGEGVYKGAYASVSKATTEGKGSVAKLVAGLTGGLAGGALYSSGGRAAYRLHKSHEVRKAERESKQAKAEFSEATGGTNNYARRINELDSQIASGHYTSYGVTQLENRKRKVKESFKRKMTAGKNVKKKQKEQEEAKKNKWKKQF